LRVNTQIAKIAQPIQTVVGVLQLKRVCLVTNQAPVDKDNIASFLGHLVHAPIVPHSLIVEAAKFTIRTVFGAKDRMDRAFLSPLNWDAPSLASVLVVTGLLAANVWRTLPVSGAMPPLVVFVLIMDLPAQTMAL